MPLDKSFSKAAFSKNVSEMMKSGHPQNQSLAAAYSVQREAKGRAFGGVAPMMGQAMNSTMPSAPLNAQASGVAPNPAMQAPMGMIAGTPGLAGSRGFATGGGVSNTFKGPIISAVPGRTDKHFTHVPSGAFVIPADIVSANGQGNTIAGMHSLQKLFRMGPHASNSTKSGNALNNIRKMAKGGSTDRHVGRPVPVKLAGGEIVIPPENAHETMQRITGKKLTLSQAHAALDAWVLNQRKKLRKTLAKLPGPAKD